jgi:hypothetical protein
MWKNAACNWADIEINRNFAAGCIMPAFTAPAYRFAGTYQI